MNHKLAARVNAVNRVNYLANQLYERLVPIFRQFVGEEIMNAGGLKAKIKKLLPDMANTNSLRIYDSSTAYQLKWTICVSAPDDGSDGSGPHTVLYQDAVVYIGNLQERFLISTCEPRHLRTDYTVEGVQRMRQKYQDAYAAMQEAKDALGPFETFDR